MSQLNVDNIQNRTGSNGGPNFPSGITVAVGQTAYIHGNLQVDGTETIVNTETLNVADKTVGIGSTSNASNTTADGSGIEVFASSSQTGNNKTLTWGNTANSWEFGPNDVGLKVGTGVTIYGETGIVSATSFKGDGSLLTGIDATTLKDTDGTVRVQANTSGAVITGVATVGVLSATTLYGSGANLTGIDAAPQVKVNASGSISAGNAVVANADGTVSKIGLSYSAVDPISILGCPSELNYPDNSTATADWLTCQLEDNYMAVAWNNDSAPGRIDVAYAKVDGISVTWSTNYVSVTGVNGTLLDLQHDPTRNQAVIVYKLNDDRVYFRTLRRNPGATSISTGTQHQLNNTAAYADVKLSYDTAANKFLIVYGKDPTQSNYCTAQVMTVVDNDTLTFGSLVTIKANQCAHIAADFDTSAGKHLVLYRDNSVSNDCYGIVATISGTSVTFGTAVELETGNNEGAKIKYSTTDSKFLWLSLNESGGEVDVSVLTISGTSVSRGTNTTITTNTAGMNSGTMAISYEPNLDVFYILYRNNYIGKKRTATISGTNVTVGSESNSRCAANSVADCDIAYDKGSKKTLLVMQNGGSNAGLYQVWTTATSTTNVTAENYLGVSDGNYTNGQLATIKLSGNTDNNQSGLTPGQNYFARNDGTISLTSQSPQVFVGNAVSSTKLTLASPVAEASGYQVVSSHVLDGVTENLDFTGWSNEYAEYQVILSNVYNSSGFKIWIQVYTDATSGNTGTLQTGNTYGYGAPYSRADTMVNQVQGNGYWGKNQHVLGTNQGTRTYWSGYQTFPMKTGNYSTGRMIWNGNTRGNYEHMYVTESGWYQPADTAHHITGIRIGFWNSGGSSQMTPSGGRITLMRLKV